LASDDAGWSGVRKHLGPSVPFGAGGGTDSLARYWAERLGQAFGQQFVVENRGGASGTIGTEAMAKSAPDGYTLLLSSNSSTVNLPLLRKVPYDPKSLHPSCVSVMA
jgi:tripartite-type tricarboxylate transporter receptor subunit TctC